jgi:hypothetical protein
MSGPLVLPSTLALPSTLDASVEKYPILILSDVATSVAAAIESKIYYGRVDLKACGMAGLVGIVARYVEKFIADQNTSQRFFSNDYRDQKNQLIVFVISYLLTSSSKNALRYGFMGVNADLLGKWMVESVTTDRSLFSM